MLNSSQTGPTRPKSIPASIDITSHHIHSTGPVAYRPSDPLTNSWPSASRNPQRAYLTTTSSNPIRRIGNAITPFRGSPPTHPHPPHALQLQMRAAFQTPDQHPRGTRSHAGVLHSAYSPMCQVMHHLRARLLFVVAVVSAVVVDVSGCHQHPFYAL